VTQILIPTYPHDVHALEVALALRRWPGYRDRCHDVVCWFGTDFPHRQTSSLWFEGDAFAWEARSSEPDPLEDYLSIGECWPPRPGGFEEPFDVVWMRRPSYPVLPDDLDPADRPVAERELGEYVRGLWHLMAPEAAWVNPLESRGRESSKAVQLREAARVGLTIPPTLMSNDPGHIRRFLERFGGRGVYKPFYPARWDGDETSALLLATEVSVDDLPEPRVLQWTPGIFQPHLPKSHELRVTWMGSHLVTARLGSQETDMGRVDWRAAQPELPVSPAMLPAEVEAACSRLMDRLGLVFGCFDFIVTPEGEHVFLEVNPMGQFLWVEEANPEVRVLAPFCEFLMAGGSRDFRRDGGDPMEGPRHGELWPEVLDWVRRHSDRHVRLPHELVGPDSTSEAVAGASGGNPTHSTKGKEATS
jgi:hypothetical protein